MQHSVKWIAKNYSEISSKRKDKKLFKFDDFINFAKENKKKYSLIENGEDILVSRNTNKNIVNKIKFTKWYFYAFPKAVGITS